MARLTIEEVIAHCERKTEVQEQIMQKEMLETLPLENSWIKEYWEHRQVREWLMELQKIRKQPTIEAEPVKHGKWVVTHLPDVFQCDYCKKATKMDELCDSEILRAYCPNCGARMDGE